MNKLISATILSAAACGLLAAPSVSAKEKLKGEAKLEKMLEGREAGEPSRCIRTLGSSGFTKIDGTALVYRQGRTLWVNRTRNPESIDDDDYLVIRKYGGSASQLCRLDNVTTRDRFGNFFTGVILLEDFVPYRLKEEAEG